MRLIGDNESVDVNDMKDGDIATITAWTNDRHVGKIVQRYVYDLVYLGNSSNDSWPMFFGEGVERKVCRVKILPKGTRLEI